VRPHKTWRTKALYKCRPYWGHICTCCSLHTNIRAKRAHVTQRAKAEYQLCIRPKRPSKTTN